VETQLTLRELEERVGVVDPAVLLVSPRILRRVIRLDRRFGAFDFGVPHRKCYAIACGRLFEFVSRFELELDDARELPETVLLLERPDDDALATRPAAEILFDCWRLLFHIRVHVELERRIKADELTEDHLLDRLRPIGSPEYAEIRAVLQREEMLLPPETDLSCYVEFAAVFLELRHFAPEQLAWYFPALQEYEGVVAALARDIDAQALYEATRLPGANGPTAAAGEEESEADETAVPVEPTAVDPLLPSPPAFWRLLARSEKVGSLGNTVKAAILRCKASRLALPDRIQETKVRARAELERLARRLQPVLGLSDDETRQWAAALVPVLEGADQGFRSLESRLLYDLQKVCVEQERGLYTVDLVEWCRSLGRVPLRRPLPLLREVMVAKYLQHAARKLRKSRLAGEARQRLSRLIESAVGRAQQQLRDRVRPMVADVLTAEGLRPRNVPERVAFNKIVEELVDRVVDRGYLSLGQLRDALSQNNLKLPDLTSLWELLTGDALLRVDNRLAIALDGVYHRGPIYLRWSQRLSAMAFGTAFGRFLTRYLALPFGGAFLLIEFVRHIVHSLAKRGPHGPSELPAEQLTNESVAGTTALMPYLWNLAPVVFLGVFLLLLLEHARFRQWCLDRLWDSARAVRRMVYDLPVALLRLPWVRRFLDSPVYAALVGYGVKPLAFTAALLLPLELAYGRVTWGTAAITFLAINLFLNSPLGRYLDQVITDELVRGWRELQIRVLAAGLRMVIDVFQWLMQAIEQVVYTVDEWLLFRTGDRRWMLVAKAVLGFFWSVIAYVVRFCVTLLIEPQVNPLKHFPVVTVSHKMLIPSGPLFVRQLAPYLGLARANTIVWSTIWLIPGVFGFLVWELKENWRLYAANRAQHLKPVPIGSHGETLLRLLRLGFHSGTVPRRFGRLRRAGRVAARTGQRKAVHEHREKLDHVEQVVRHFVERELLALLALCPSWRDKPLEVGRIRLATNLVSIEVGRGDGRDDPVVLMFQQRAGWIIASMPRRGWLDAAPRDERQAFLNALNGLYKYAGVDLIWERLEERLGADLVWHEVHSDGLLLWRDRRYHFAELYRLRDTGAPAQVGNPLRYVTQPPASELDELLFSRRPLEWESWVAMWERTEV
jgi:hypothetical protein